MATAVLVAGLGFGDEGKGTTVDYLCAERKADLVIRYNGGPQAAHNVVTPNGQHHTFAQIGSGFFQGAHTYLSRYMVVDPLALMEEARALDEKARHYVLDTVHVDKQAVVVTPYHRAASRILECVRGDKGRHGSCGIGVGEARRDELDGLTLKMGSLINRPNTTDTLKAIQAKKMKELPPDWEKLGWPEDVKLLKSEPEHWAELYGTVFHRLHLVDENFLLGKQYKYGTLVFEGAQGVLLDEDCGFYPYNTWTKTTFENAEKLLKDIGFNGLVEKVGVLRTYMTRHGAGPFPTELRMSVHHDSKKKVEHNGTGPWQGEFRTGHLDLVALRYAVEVCGGVDYLSLTHMDCQPRDLCWAYSGTESGFFSNEARMFPVQRSPNEMLKLTDHLFEVKPQLERFSVEMIERNLKANVRVESYGPTCRDKKEARWARRNE